MSGTDSLEVVIVSAHRLLAEGLQRLLRDGTRPVRCRTITDLPSLGALPAIERGLLVFAPADWREMRDGLPLLQHRFRSWPWLMLADGLIAGLFLSSLEQRTITVMGSHQPPEDLRDALWALVEGEVLCPAEDLLAKFERGAAQSPNGRRGLRLRSWQLEVGCALAMELRNDQIARVRNVTEGTVRNEISALEKLLGVADRKEIGRLFRDARAWNE